MVDRDIIRYDDETDINRRVDGEAVHPTVRRLF